MVMDGTAGCALAGAEGAAFAVAGWGWACTFAGADPLDCAGDSAAATELSSARVKAAGSTCVVAAVSDLRWAGISFAEVASKSFPAMSFCCPAVVFVSPAIVATH